MGWGSRLEVKPLQLLWTRRTRRKRREHRENHKPQRKRALSQCSLVFSLCVLCVLCGPRFWASVRRSSRPSARPRRATPDACGSSCAAASSDPGSCGSRRRRADEGACASAPTGSAFDPARAKPSRTILCKSARPAAPASGQRNKERVHDGPVPPNQRTSRHWRRFMRARYSITQQLVAVMPSSLQISSVSRPMSSRR